MNSITIKKLKMLCLSLLLGFAVMAQTWQNVGGTDLVSAGGSSFNNLVIDATGNYYLSYYDLSVTKGSVQKFNGTAWSYLGGSAGITSGSATYNSLSIDGLGNVYYTNQLAYPGTGLEVRQFNGTAWSQLTSATTSSVNYQASAVSPSNVLFTYSNDGSGTVRRLVNGTWEQVGTAGFPSGATFAEMVIGSDNMVYTCNVAGGSAQVYKNSVTASSTESWTLVGGATVGAAASSEQYTSDIAIDADNNLYVAYVSNSAGGNKLNVKKFNGTEWVQLGAANFSAGKTQHVALAVSAGGQVFVVASRWENDNYLLNTAYAFDADANAWNALGGDFISDGQATYNDLAVDNLNHYLVLAYSQSGTRVLRIAIDEDEAPATGCANTEPGNNPGDTGCVSFTYNGQTVSYTTVRGADGNIWLQQNLGADGVASAMDQEASYGDLYQWGRWDDGHQKRTSATTATAADPNNPAGLGTGQDTYITSTPAWWSGNALTDTWTAETPAAATDTDGCDPCKALGQGWVMPTQDNWTALVDAEAITNPASAFASNLKLPANGYRSNTTGGFTFAGQRGYYWSSTTSSSGAKYLYVGTTIANPGAGAPRGQGAAVRCVKMAQQQVQSVAVTTQNSVPATITTAAGTLQLVAAITPATASQAVTWSVTTGGTFATVSATGLVTATANGTVTVRATSVADVTKYGEITVTVSNQSTGNGITGYNFDIIANGVGNASQSSGLGLDEVNSRALVSLDFQATASSAYPTYGLPANGTINSAATAGVTYQLANYNGPNALYLTPSYVTGSANTANSGTLSFQAQNAGVVYILSAAAGGGSSNLPFTATVNFSDGTSQQASLNAKDWYNGTGFAIKGIGRVNRANNNLEGDAENPRLYEHAITLAAANQTKTITGITFAFTGDATAEYANEIRFAVLSVTTGPVVADVLTVVTLNNAPATITTNSGILELDAYLNGSYTSDITWSIVAGGTGNANVDIYGKVTASANGTVTVRATSTANPDLYGEITITITNQAEGYCESYFVNGCSYLSISGVSTTGGSTNISNLSSGCSNDNALTGYGDFTTQTVTASPGSTVNFTVNFSTNTAYLSVWVDWNHDFVFSDDEREYFTGSAETQSTTAFAITVPADATLAATRIRLKAVNGWEGSGPCGYNSMGEVEDYTFTVAAPVVVTGVTVTTQNSVPATITTAGGTLQLVAAVAPANASQNVTWTIASGSTFATVDANGLVTATANGTVTVRATSVADATQYGEITVTVNAEPACPSLTELYENFDTLSCCALGLVPECWESIMINGSNQIISSTTPASGTSNVYMNGYGAGKIAIVVLPHFSNVSAGTHQFRFKVRANSTGLLDFGYITDTTDETTFVTLEAMTINNTTYNSEAERVFIVPTTVPANARLAIRNPGTSWAGIYWDDVYWEPIAVTSVVVTTQNNVPATIATQGGTRQLVATVNPSAVSQSVTWSIVSGSEYATVDANGLVTATANGTVTVRATSVADTTKYDDIEIVISYTIAVQSVVVTTQNNVPATISTEDGTLQLVATVAPANATNQNVTWSIVSGAEYATVDANGLVTATGNGTVVVRATSAANVMLYGEITVTISYTIAVESVVVTTQNNVPAEITVIDGTLQLVATITPADADNQDVVWTIVSGAEYATVDANGLVTATNNGTVVIRATSAEDSTVYDEITITLTNQLTCEELHPGATEPITLVNFAGINNESSATVGGAFTENFMSVTGTAERGQEYTLTVKGNTNGDFAHTVTAYIDWNQDMDFSDENEVYEVGTLQNTTGTDATQVTLAITVPETAALGNATLRIAKKLAEGEIECNTGLYGQTEYYTLTVTETTGTHDFEANSISVYPNPVADVLNIEATQDVSLTEVYSALGQKVLAAKGNTINMSGLASGVYVVRVVLQNGASQNIKIVKQ